MLQTTIESSLQTLRESGAYGRLEDIGMLAIHGTDATRFLQSQTTNDVAKLPEVTSQLSCILDRKAHVKAFFQLYRKHKSYRIVADKEQIEKILFHLDTYRFADKVEFVDETERVAFFTVQGPKALQCVASGLQSESLLESLQHDLCDINLFHHQCLILRKSICGEDGFIICCSEADSKKIWKELESACKKLAMIPFTAELIETARIESGIPIYGIDFSEANFLPEAGLDEKTVSYTKGCFLGQEVLARVKSQGAPTRGLVGLVFDGNADTNFPMDSKVSTDGGDVAWIKSNCYSPTLKTTIALAYVKRDYRVPDKTFVAKVDGHTYKVTVRILPFVKSLSAVDRARDCYEQALRIYTKEADDAAQSEAVALLRTALELDPKLEDAYEALGVILHKRGDIDEAISLMKTLVALNADSVMAHTNLSVFYVEKGLKEEAEEEKAISLSIRMREAAKQATQAKQDEEEKRRRTEEATQRLDMFRQVLEIDDDDLLANYGIGSCLVALDKFEEAIPYLKKAIEIKSTHTVAYVALAEAYEALGRNDDAIETYNTGIEVASKRGDMSPMNDMQRRLLALNARLKNAQ
jgi:folate-binding protein YgfZ